MYPPYYRVKMTKESCYPSDINVTETHSEIKIQSLMDHIPLCKMQEEVLKTINDMKSLDTLVKWGCDGGEENKYSNKSLFTISMVLIHKYTGNDQSEKIIVWQNPSSSSTSYSCLIKFLFAKESMDVIMMEVDKMKEVAASLSPTKIIANEMEFLVKQHQYSA
ncbi:hypothetical protein PR048_020890 [Dryococelus australis]|uniref:Uncharacterized protein n=1 Tax=Dryococelus australis TaxID=614101 RepID=A0ABQ9GWP1_9NEOP|nr:hypothetical protein PR048_020890 [Dryococelus australis]